MPLTEMLQIERLNDICANDFGVKMIILFVHVKIFNGRKKGCSYKYSLLQD